jgi:hypothetical protein
MSSAILYGMRSLRHAPRPRPRFDTSLFDARRIPRRRRERLAALERRDGGGSGSRRPRPYMFPEDRSTRRVSRDRSSGGAPSGRISECSRVCRGIVVSALECVGGSQSARFHGSSPPPPRTGRRRYAEGTGRHDACALCRQMIQQVKVSAQLHLTA